MTQTKLKTSNYCFFSCSIKIIYIYLRQLWEKRPIYALHPCPYCDSLLPPPAGLFGLRKCGPLILHTFALLFYITLFVIDFLCLFL